MLRLPIIFLTVLFIASVLAAPTPKKHRKRSFKIPRTRQQNYVPNGPKALLKAYRKFGFLDVTFLKSSNITSILDAASTVSDIGQENGTVTASPIQNDAEFLSPVVIGGQTLVMDFDTGSSDMWVFNTQLPSSLQTGHTIYDPSQSSTFAVLQNSFFNISYGDGSFSAGTVGVDTVDIGGATVTQQAIGLPTIVASSFVQDVASNGLVGLAFSDLNTIKPRQQKTFFDNIMADLEQPVFTADLLHGQAGSYEFGFIDTTKFQGSLSTAAIDNSRGFWEFSSTSAVINGQTLNINGGLAIADTGTTLMLVDPSLVEAYYNQVDGAQLDNNVGGVIFPCTSTLPDLQVAVGDNSMATILGSLMNFSVAGTERSTGVEFCFGGLQSNQGLGFSIFGDVFFKSQFVVFDGSGPSLSFAPHA